jgi:hypothetical protein
MRRGLPFALMRQARRGKAMRRQMLSRRTPEEYASLMRGYMAWFMVERARRPLVSASPALVSVEPQD